MFTDGSDNDKQHYSNDEEVCRNIYLLFLYTFLLVTFSEILTHVQHVNEEDYKQLSNYVSGGKNIFLI